MGAPGRPGPDRSSTPAHSVPAADRRGSPRPRRTEPAVVGLQEEKQEETGCVQELRYHLSSTYSRYSNSYFHY